MNVSFREITEQDLDMIREWRMHPEVTRYMLTDPVLTPEDQHKWFDFIRQAPDRRDWIITYEAVDVGLLSITDIDRTHQRCSFGFYLADPGTRGKGLGISVMSKLCRYAFNDLTLHKIWCMVLASNQAARNLYKKCGFKEEGFHREHIFKNGVFMDTVDMALRKEEWLSTQLPENRQENQ